MMNYNKIFSIAWIWGPFVLSLAYTGLAGMETPSQNCATLHEIYSYSYYPNRNSHFPPDKGLATRLFPEC